MASMRQWIAWAEKRIAGVVVAEGLHVGLVGVVQGPLTVTFRTKLLQPSPGALRKIQGIGPALAQALSVDAVRVANTAHGILIEIPSPRPKTPTAAALAMHSHGLQMAVGLDQWRRPVIVDLAHHPTLLFVGPSRKGKTQALKSVLYALARTPFQRLQFVIFSQKRQDWTAFEDLRGCLGLVSEPGESAQALEWAAGHLLQERARAGSRTPAVILVLDDLLNLLKRCPEAAGPIGEIASMGGGCGLFQLIGTQDAGSKRGTGGGDVEANVTARIVYRAASATTAARAAGAGGVGIEDLSGHKGDGLLIVDGETHRVATAYASDLEIACLPSGAIGRRPWLDTGADMGQTAADRGANRYPAPGGYSRLYPGQPPANGVNGDAGDAHERGGAGTDMRAAISFPIGEARPLHEAEQAEVRRLARLVDFQYRGEVSINRLTIYVYGSKNPERAAWIRAALNVSQEKNEPKEEPTDFDQIDLNTETGRAALAALQKSGALRLPDVSGLWTERE
jgi:hypothetical protein